MSVAELSTAFKMFLIMASVIIVLSVVIKHDLVGRWFEDFIDDEDEKPEPTIFDAMLENYLGGETPFTDKKLEQLLADVTTHPEQSKWQTDDDLRKALRKAIRSYMAGQVATALRAVSAHQRSISEQIETTNQLARGGKDQKELCGKKNTAGYACTLARNHGGDQHALKIDGDTFLYWYDESYTRPDYITGATT